MRRILTMRPAFAKRRRKKLPPTRRLRDAARNKSVVGSMKESRGERRFAFPIELGESELFGKAIAQTVEFTADTFFSLGT